MDLFLSKIRKMEMENGKRVYYSVKVRIGSNLNIPLRCFTFDWVCWNYSCSGRGNPEF